LRVVSTNASKPPSVSKFCSLPQDAWPGGRGIPALATKKADFARRLTHVDNLPHKDSAQNALTKLARTSAAQVSALKDCCSKGEQIVAEGGQAIVRNVSASAPGVGKAKEQPHALAPIHRASRCREIEAERPAMPIASHAGRLLDAWRQRRRAARG
jgi:hypothetical protein